MMMAATSCCKCNGSNAKCKRCDCVKKGKPCVNCVPIHIGTCHNTVTLRQDIKPTEADCHLARALSLRAPYQSALPHPNPNPHVSPRPRC